MSALRPLGRSGLSVPPLAFCAYAIGGTYRGPSDDDAAGDAIVRAFEGGSTAVDTAPVYGFGHSERLVARARVAHQHLVGEIGALGEDLLQHGP